MNIYLEYIVEFVVLNTLKSSNIFQFINCIQLKTPNIYLLNGHSKAIFLCAYVETKPDLR